jgi:hypothetical protein
VRGVPIGNSRTAVSAVLAVVMITTATIVMVITASYWTGGLVTGFTRFEKVEVEKIYIVQSDSGYVVTIGYINTGSALTSIESIYLNGILASSYAPPPTLGDNFSALPSLCETGVSKRGTIVIPSGSTDPSGNKVTAGTALTVTLHTTGGKDYSASVTLP